MRGREVIYAGKWALVSASFECVVQQQWEFPFSFLRDFYLFLIASKSLDYIFLISYLHLGPDILEVAEHMDNRFMLCSAAVAVIYSRSLFRFPDMRLSRIANSEISAEFLVNKWWSIPPSGKQCV